MLNTGFEALLQMMYQIIGIIGVAILVLLKLEPHGLKSTDVNGGHWSVRDESY